MVGGGTFGSWLLTVSSAIFGGRGGVGCDYRCVFQIYVSISQRSSVVGHMFLTHRPPNFDPTILDPSKGFPALQNQIVVVAQTINGTGIYAAPERPPGTTPM